MAERGEAGPGAWPRCRRSSRASEIVAERAIVPAARLVARPACRPPRARHQRPDARADRPGALHRQSLVGQAGARHRRARPRARRARDADHRARSSLPDPAGRRLVHVETARRDAARRCEAACRPTSRSSPRPSPTGARRRSRARRSRRRGEKPPALELVENPDILATVGKRAPSAPAAGRRLCRRDRATSSRTPPRSASARAPTGSSPTTCRRRRGVLGGDGNTVHLVTADGVERLAGHEQGRGRASV